MLKIRVIPCLTVKQERLVKSVRFADHRNIGSYIAVVRVFDARDVDELILLDLDAEARGIHLPMLREVTKECMMPVTLGGGVRSIEDVQAMLSAGADKVAINSAALEDPSLIGRAAARFGSQCVVVSIDAKRVGERYEVYSHGGTKATGREVVEWATEAQRLGAGEILLTSIDRDGTMEGYDLELVSSVARAVAVPVIACGGAGNPEDGAAAVEAGASAVALASLFQYTQTTPQTVKEALASGGFPARLAVK